MKDECHCNGSFRTVEDYRNHYRDHLPCRPRTPHFNRLQPDQAEGLAILAEECAEVTQRITKILRNGLDSRQPSTGLDNVTLLEMEIGDLIVALDLLVELKMIDEDRILDHSEEKERKFREEPGRLHHITVKS